MNSLHPKQRTLFTVNFFLLFAIVYFSFFSTDFLIPVLPLYTMELGGSEFYVGLLAGLFYTCSIAFRPLLGRKANRCGLRPLLVFGSGLYSAAGLGLLFFPSLPALYLFRAAQGVGWGSFLLAFNTLAINIAPPSRKGESVGVLGVASMGSLATAPWLAECLRHYLVDYRLFFGLTILTSLVSLLLSLIFTEPAADRAGPPDVNRSIFSRKAVLPSAVIFFLALPFGATLTFIPLMGLQRSISSVGAFFTVFSMAAIIIRPLAGILSDRWGRLVIFLPGLAVQFLSALLIARAATSGQLLLGGFLLSAGISLAYPSLMALVSDLLPPAERTAGIATFTMAHDLGQTCGSFFSGLVLLRLNFTELYYLFAVISLLPLTLLPALKQAAARSLPASNSSAGKF